MTSRPPALFARTRVARVSISADAYDHAMDSLVLVGGAHQPVPMTAQAIDEGAEYRALLPGARKLSFSIEAKRSIGLL